MADFYGTVAGFKAYHIARDNDVPVTIEDDDIQAALLVASEWLDARYVNAFPGLKTGARDQLREWPRTGVIDMYGYPIGAYEIPREIENATYEGALRQAINPGSLSVDWTPGKYKRVAVDGAVSVEYAVFGSSSEVQTQFTIIDGILRPILTGSGADFAALSGSIARV